MVGEDREAYAARGRLGLADRQRGGRGGGLSVYSGNVRPCGTSAGNRNA
jgi:hypothetical protein